MNILKKKLIENNMSQSELARKIGKSKQYVYLLCRYEKPSLETAINIAKILNMSNEELSEWITRKEN